MKKIFDENVRVDSKGPIVINVDGKDISVSSWAIARKVYGKLKQAGMNPSKPVHKSDMKITAKEFVKRLKWTTV